MADGKVCRIFNVGLSPANLAITSDGHYAYVANSNNYSIPNNDSVTVLDLQKGVPELTIHHSSFDEPYRIAIDFNDKFAYVCNSASSTISIIDIETNKVTAVINGFDGPGSIVISGTLAYVTNYGIQSGTGTTVSVVDLNRRAIIDTITVDLAPASIVLSHCTNLLYVICYVNGEIDDGVLNIINTRTNRVIGTIPGLFGPFGIVLTKNNRYAYISEFGSNNFSPYGTTVSIVDIRERQIIKKIHTGIQPSGIVITQNYVYVSNYNTLYAKPDFQSLTSGEGTISIIRICDNEVINTISVGQNPSTITLSPDEKKLYVCKYIQNTVAEICLD